jgi:hypothetical protein
MNEEKNAFTALYVGERNVTSRGGYVFSFLVTYDDVDEARRVLGGSWRPDEPVNVGIVPIALRASVVCGND